MSLIKIINKEVLIRVASAVAKQAVEEGVARIDDFDVEAYKAQLRCIAYECPDEA